MEIQCRKPVIAAIHNACIGGGVDFITAADIRICTEDAYFQVTMCSIALHIQLNSSGTKSVKFVKFDYILTTRLVFCCVRYFT